MTLPSHSQFHRAVIVTDHNNPDESVMKQAAAYGDIVAKVACAEGFVVLLKCSEEMCHKINQTTEA